MTLLLTRPAGRAAARTSPAGRRTGPVALVGILLGLAAATVGVRSVGLPLGVSIFALLTLLALAVAVAGTLARPQRGVRVTPLDLAFVGYIAYRGIIELVNASSIATAAMAPVVDLVVSYLAIWAVRISVDLAAVPRFLRLFALTSIPVSVIAVFQIIRWPGVNEALLASTRSDGLANRLEFGWSIRATSTIGHWTSLGGYLCGIVAICCYLLIVSRMRDNKLVIASLLLALVAQGATLTLAPMLLSAVIIAFTFRRLQLKFVLGLGAVVAVVIGWVLFGDLVSARLDQQLGARSTGAAGFLPETVDFRLGVWLQQTIPSIQQSPFLGWGNRVYSANPSADRPSLLVWRSPESEWFRVAMEAGLVALLLLVVLLVQVVRAYRAAERAQPSSRVLLVYLVGLLVISGFHSHLSNRGAPLVLWVITAVIMVLADGAPSRAGSRWRR